MNKHYLQKLDAILEFCGAVTHELMKLPMRYFARFVFTMIFSIQRRLINE